MLPLWGRLHKQRLYIFATTFQVMILGNTSKQNQPVVVLIGAKSQNHYDFKIFPLPYFLVATL